MMLSTQVDEDFTNPRGEWKNEDTGELMNPKDMGWNELAEQQRLNEEQAQIKANRQAFDQYIAIEDGAKQQKLALDHQRAIAGAAMIQSAFRNGGMSDRSLSAAFSQAFGRPIYGGQLVGGMNIGNGPETVFAMYGAAKDPQTGKATIAPVAMMGTREMLQVLKRAGLGDATNAIQDSLINNSYLGKLTDDQRAAMGVSRPAAPITTGGAGISAAGVRALRGLPRPRSSVSSYYSDGAGGEVRTYSGSETGYQNVREASGTFSPDYQGRWKVTSVGADPNDRRYDASGNEVYNASPRQIRRYENSRTGEVVNVPDGSTLRDVLRGTSEKEKVAQINAQGRVDSAKLAAELKRMGYDIDEKKLEESRRHHEEQEKNEQARIASDQEKAERATRTRVGTMINPQTGLPINPEVLDEIKGDLDKSKKAKEPVPEPSPNPASSGDNTNTARQISSPSEMKDAPVGSWFMKGGKKYVKQSNGRWE
jgi:hypothetical protein